MSTPNDAEDAATELREFSTVFWADLDEASRIPNEDESNESDEARATARDLFGPSN